MRNTETPDFKKKRRKERKKMGTKRSLSLIGVKILTRAVFLL